MSDTQPKCHPDCKCRYGWDHISADHQLPPSRHGRSLRGFYIDFKGGQMNVAQKLIEELIEDRTACQALQSVMDWNPKPEYWERPEAASRFEADIAKARMALEETA